MILVSGLFGTDFSSTPFIASPGNLNAPFSKLSLVNLIFVGVNVIYFWSMAFLLNMNLPGDDTLSLSDTYEIASWSLKIRYLLNFYGF